MCVAGLSAEPLIANRINGKTIGKITRPRWRTVRRTARRPRAMLCSAKLAPRAELAVPRALPVVSTATSPPAAPVRLLGGLSRWLAFRSLQLSTGLRQEHVVERGLMELEGLDMQIRPIENPDDLGQLGLAARQLHRDAATAIAPHLAKGGEQLAEPMLGVRLGRRPLQRR